MPDTRIAVIGSGGMASRHAENFARLDGAEFVAVASRNADTGGALAARCGAEYVADWQEACRRDDIDAIVIATYNDTHGPIAIDALNHGKHVLTEYPLARSIGDGETALTLATHHELCLRTTHSEPTSNVHAALKEATAELGDLMLASFARWTPGRGARPEILFNIPISGPPAHFFVYHIYPYIDLFGPAAWVQAASEYDGMRDDGRYDAFVNTLTVGFKRGGVGSWTWAGGVEIEAADQRQDLTLTKGSLIARDGAWKLSKRGGTTDLAPLDGERLSNSERWLREIASGDHSAALADTQVALDTIRVSLTAERAMDTGERISL